MANYSMQREKVAFSAGLTEKEVIESRMLHGENYISRKKRKSFLRCFFESFGDPMIIILLVALFVNVILLFGRSNWFESIGIAVAILLATLVSTLSEYGSESAFEKLQEAASHTRCRVERSEGIRDIPVDQVVVGDVVLLQSGDRIPADGVIISGRLEVDQSSLNGESRESSKYPQSIEQLSRKSSTDFLQPNLLFSGTVISAGEGYMRVAAVGDKTVYGRIGAEIQEETRESPLKYRLSKLAAGIGKFSFVAAVFTLLAYLFNVILIDNEFNTHLIMRTLNMPGVMVGHIIKAATLAVTVIIMAVPEGLPMMTTVVLSSNMKRMLKDNVLVRKLTGIETAGSLNILFTDKTGTLTRGKLEVTHFVSGEGKTFSNRQMARMGEGIRSILCESIYLNSAAILSGGEIVGGNSTEKAVLKFASSLGKAPQNIKKGKVIPFSSAAKFMATTMSAGRSETLIKGAPEKILPFCTAYYDESGSLVKNLDRSKMESLIQKMSDQAIRVIALAVSETPVSEKGNFVNLRLVGLLGIRDDIRAEAPSGIHRMERAGIQMVMVTGDSKQTALAVAKELLLIKHQGELIISSDELNAMSDEQLTHILPNLRVVARALPADKSRLVRIAQAKGLVVGMTGDGVNDAPALKQADVGFAMGSGTEIAKEAGDIVILDDNLASITKAVCYGRAAFKSIRKFIIYQLSICMCAMGVTIIGLLIGTDFPITVIQMLWINIVMDSLAGLAFSGEAARKKYMEEAPKSRDEPIINKFMLGQIAVYSVYMTAICLFFLKSDFFQALFSEGEEIYMLTAFFALFMFSAIFTSFCARTPKANPFDYLAANKPFLWIMGFVTIIQVFIIYFGGAAFRTVPLQPFHLAVVILLAFSIIPVDMLRKLISGQNAERSGI